MFPYPFTETTALLTRRSGGLLAAGGCSAVSTAGERLDGITNAFAEPSNAVADTVAQRVQPGPSDSSTVGVRAEHPGPMFLARGHIVAVSYTHLTLPTTPYV